MEAWHFLRKDGCLNYPPHSKVEPGVTLKLDGAPMLCERGYHASVRAIDALYYAPGPIVCRVVVGGVVVHGTDKLVATERTVLWMADASTTLHEFACDQAEAALGVAKVDDAWCPAWAASAAVRDAAAVRGIPWAAAWDAANEDLTRRLLALAPGGK